MTRRRDRYANQARNQARIDGQTLRLMGDANQLRTIAKQVDEYEQKRQETGIGYWEDCSGPIGAVLRAKGLV